MAVVARALRPDITIVGAQSDKWASMLAATTGTEVELGGATLAEGIAVPVAGTLTSVIVKELVDEIVTVRASIEEAMNLLLDIEKVVVEGAGAVGIAALLEHPHRLPHRQVGVVLTGGNVDPRLLAVGDHARVGPVGATDGGLQIEIPDVPGALGTVTTTIGGAGGNIVEIGHQRLFLDVPVRSAELEVIVETLDHAHVERVITALAEVGLMARVGNVTFGPSPT